MRRMVKNEWRQLAPWLFGSDEIASSFQNEGSVSIYLQKSTKNRQQWRWNFVFYSGNSVFIYYQYGFQTLKLTTPGCRIS